MQKLSKNTPAPKCNCHFHVADKDAINAGHGWDMIDGSKDTIKDFDARGKDSDITDLTAVKNSKDLMKNHVYNASSNIVIDLCGGPSIKLPGVRA